MTRFVIDITRYISRMGQGKPTGIDRVEHAYIREIFTRDATSLAIGKIGKDYVVVPIQNVIHSLDAIEADAEFGKFGMRDFLRFKLPVKQRKARQYFRSVSICMSQNLEKLLLAVDLSSAEYVNVGHSNLSANFFSQLRKAGIRKLSVMVHDMIPLDYPEYTRDGISEQFENRMKSVANNADRIICNSAYTEERVNFYFNKWGFKPETTVAHLGVKDLPSLTVPLREKPYFVSLGTIEPRKNHALLFKVWEEMLSAQPQESVPELHIVGKRGWKNEAVFEFLDTSQWVGKKIFEFSDLSDVQLANKISNCSGLVFPSFAEGFGLPALEAAQMGVPVLCSDLPVFHEILGSYAQFLPLDNKRLWIDALESVAHKTDKSGQNSGNLANIPHIPRWESHFCHVFGNT